MRETLLIFSLIKLRYLDLIHFCSHFPINIHTSRLLLLIHQKAQLLRFHLLIRPDGLRIRVEVGQYPSWEVFNKGHALLVIDRQHLIVPMPAAISPNFPNPRLFQGQGLTHIVQYLVAMVEVAQLTVINVFLKTVVAQLKHFIIGLVLKIRDWGHTALVLFLCLPLSHAIIQSWRLYAGFWTIQRGKLRKLIVGTRIRNTELVLIPQFNDIGDRKRLILLIQLQRGRQKIKPDIIRQQIPIDRTDQQTKEVITGQTQTISPFFAYIALHRKLLAPDILNP